MGQIIVSRQVFCFPDTSQDLFLCLGIDPYPTAFLALHACHLLHQPVDVFSFPSRVGTDIDTGHIRPVQKGTYDLKLLFHAADHFVLPFLWQKWQGTQGPALVFFIIDFRITHGHQMTHTPGHYRFRCLQIAVFSAEIQMQRFGEFLGHTWFFRNI